MGAAAAQAVVGRALRVNTTGACYAPYLPSFSCRVDHDPPYGTEQNLRPTNDCAEGNGENILRCYGSSSILSIFLAPML